MPDGSCSRLSAAASARVRISALFSPQAWLRSALTNRFLVYTGRSAMDSTCSTKIPVRTWRRRFRWNRYPLLALPILLAWCYAMAALSWNLLEKPFLRLKRFFEAKAAPSGPANRKLALALQATD